MEQRSAPRKRADFGAVVSCRQFGLFRGEIQNLSSDGLYVRTNSVTVLINSPVSITVLTEPGNTSSCCEMEGLVVRQDRHGIGIRILGLDARKQALFQKMLAQLPFEGSEEAAALAM